MNIILAFNDNRYWTVGSYIKRELAKQDDINIVAHTRIPEDTGICEEQCGLDADLILVIDDGVSRFKLHHHRDKLPKKTKTAYWGSDFHREDWAAWRKQMIREWKYDHVFYAQKNFKEQIMSCGYKSSECSWLPHAVDPEIFKPMPQIKKKYDIGYVGFLNDRRKEIATVLQDIMRFKHFNSVWEVNAARAINECKIGFNISVEDDVLNMRTFETMACGLPLLVNKVVGNGLEDHFEDGKDLLTYADLSELKEKAVRLLANPDYRNSIAENGRLKTLTGHTYRNRINTILGTMGFNLLQNY